MRAGTEGRARVDDNGDDAFGGGLPGGPDPEGADAHRPVEVPPALLPALVDLLDTAGPEDLPEPFLAACVGVGDELQAVVGLELLEPFREQLDHRRPRLLRPRGGNADRDAAPAQRNARSSIS